MTRKKEQEVNGLGGVKRFGLRGHELINTLFLGSEVDKMRPSSVIGIFQPRFRSFE